MHVPAGADTPIRSDDRPPQVMVVDNASAVLDVMRELLESEGYVVTATAFAPDSFAQIEAVRPDLLIIDLAIHDRAGWDLLERLALDALLREIPVIVTSTDPRLLARAKANPVRYDGNAWIAKPFEVGALLELVHDLIAGV